MAETTNTLKLTKAEISSLTFALLTARHEHPSCFEAEAAERLYDKLDEARRSLDRSKF